MANDKKYTRKNLKQLKNKKTKKTKLIASNNAINTKLIYLSKQYNLPSDVQSHISNSSMNKIDPKLKKDLTDLFPKLKKIQESKRYPEKIKKLSTTLFFKLPHKFKKGYIMSLDKDINIPREKTLIFLSKHWNDLVTYIGNRNESVHNEVYDFIVFYYSEQGIEPPSQVKFRNIVNSIEMYIEMSE